MVTIKPHLSKEVIAPSVIAIVGFFSGLPWYVWIGVALVCAAGFFLYHQFFQAKVRSEQDQNTEVQNQLVAEKWHKMAELTGVHDFSPKLMESEFAPSVLIKRPNIEELIFMGNGCSKWTALLAEDERGPILDAFCEIQRNNGHIKFLAACPIYLASMGKTRKAQKNARSLLKLKRIQEKSRQESGSFEIRVYSEQATWRLTIIDSRECAVGHYGGGNSAETPLLIVRRTHQPWSFYLAFVHVFIMKWGRARELSEAEWTEIHKLAQQEWEGSQ